MASDTPTDGPRTGDPAAPPSESPAKGIGSNRRRKPQPHHRPSSSEMGESLDIAHAAIGVSVVVECVPTRGIRDQLARILLEMLRKPVGPEQGR
jgi:hypothetical protein